jgi:hypothetical protein
MQTATELIEKKLTDVFRLGGYQSSTSITNPLKIVSDRRSFTRSSNNFPFIKREELCGSPWFMPKASYEFAPAFYLWYGISKFVDLLLIRGLKGNPKTNLRWLSSYSTSIITILLIAFLMFWLFRRA